MVEAHLMKTKLESEQITCYLFDENIVGLNPLFSVAVGGVKLKIRKDDIDMASLILNESENTTLKNEHGETVRCPRCLSDNLYYGFKSIMSSRGLLSIIASFLLLVYPFYFKTVKRCKSCGKEFD